MPDPPHARRRGHLRRARAAGHAGLTPLTRDDLREALGAVLLDARDAVSISVHGRTESAVLVPLYVDDRDHVRAVFTKRRDDLRRHPGEISFPGGRREDADGDLTVTALREAEEEIGLPRGAVELLGALQPTPTFVTNYSIYPFVGLIEAGRAWELQALEVDRVLELSLADVRDGYARRRLVRRGVPFRTDTYCVDDDLIWGATARIVADLLDRVGPLL
jgi:8-oxo-dGTP pyrophosphatase MutT (NUDIX family)